MNNKNLFDSKADLKTHDSWRKIAESSESDKRALCNKLYSKFEKFADRDFEHKFKLEFFPAFWEMDLACTLLDSHFELSEEYSGNKGPDLCLLDAEGKRIWIEAICVTRGNTLDEVSLGEPGQALRIDSEKIMLRLTSAIFDKYKKHKHYLELGICEKHEPFIIAINGCLLTPGPGLDDITPRIVKAVFEGGRDLFSFDKTTGAVDYREIDYRPEIHKHSNLIATNYFNTKEYNNISALLFSESSLWSRSCETGGDYITVHNPLAKNILPEGFFQFGSEYVKVLGKSGTESFKVNNYRKLENVYK